MLAAMPTCAAPTRATCRLQHLFELGANYLIRLLIYHPRSSLPALKIGSTPVAQAEERRGVPSNPCST